MIRRSSLSDIGEGEKNVEVKGKPPSPPAISSPVLEENSVMDCDDVQPLCWRVWGVTADGVHIADTDLQRPLRDTGEEYRNLWT